MSDPELMPFTYSSEEERPRKRKPLTKNQHLYGDDWESSSANDDNLPDVLIPIQANLKEKKFVKAETIKPIAQTEAQVHFQTPANEKEKKRVLKNTGKEKELKNQLDAKYGSKALKLLQKSGGYEIGQGIGKSNHGMLNPLNATKIEGKGGIGVADSKQIKADDIEMDLEKKVEAPEVASV